MQSRHVAKKNKNGRPDFYFESLWDHFGDTLSTKWRPEAFFLRGQHFDGFFLNPIRELGGGVPLKQL